MLTLHSPRPVDIPMAAMAANPAAPPAQAMNFRRDTPVDGIISVIDRSSVFDIFLAIPGTVGVRA
jgi:hypothetical protein